MVLTWLDPEPPPIDGELVYPELPDKVNGDADAAADVDLERLAFARLHRLIECAALNRREKSVDSRVAQEN